MLIDLRFLYLFLFLAVFFFAAFFFAAFFLGMCLYLCATRLFLDSYAVLAAIKIFGSGFIEAIA